MGTRSWSNIHLTAAAAAAAAQCEEGGGKEGMKRCLGQIRDYVMTAANSVTRGQLGFYGGHLRDIIAKRGKKCRGAACGVEGHVSFHFLTHSFSRCVET